MATFSHYSIIQDIKVDFAIISAMPEEIAYLNTIFTDGILIRIQNFDFKICLYNDKKILLAAIGMGTASAAVATTLIITHCQPNCILFTGTAGGIDPQLKIGDVIIATSAFEAEIQGAFAMLPGTPFETALVHPLKQASLQKSYFISPYLSELLNNLNLAGLSPGTKIYQGVVVTSNTFPSPPSLFEQIKSQAPLAIDMETSAIYQAAWLLDVDAIVIRGISNMLNHHGEDDASLKTDVPGSTENAAKILLCLLEKLINTSSLTPQIPKLATEYIERLNLKPHPEGGYFKQIFKAEMMVHSVTDTTRYDGEHRSASTSIYYLLAGNDFSAWHRIKSDEIWHHLAGDPLKIYIINTDGELVTHLLGNIMRTDGAEFEVVIPAELWFAAEPVRSNTFALISCIVTPGFEFKDFELADRKTLIRNFSQHEKIINKLTRE